MVVGATVALFCFHLWASHRIIGPSVVYDEAGYLGNARWLAGGARWDMPTSPSYAIGYPLLLIPIMRAFGSAPAQWHAVMAVNAALLASVFPLLAVTLRRVFGLRTRVALGGALLGALSPAVITVGISAIPENLVMPLVLLAVLSAWWTTHSAATAPPLARYLFGPVVAALVITHPRFAMAAPVVVVGLLGGAVRRIVPPRIAVVNTIALIALVVAGRWLTSRVVDGRWDTIHRPEGGPSTWVALTRSIDGLRELGLGVVGQGWYLAAGSLGLSVAGLIVVGQTVFGAPLPWHPRPPDGTSTDRRFVLGIIAAMAVMVFVTSVTFFAQDQFRADHWIYGRHNDSFSPLWVALGACALIEGSIRWRRCALGVAAAVIAATGWILVSARHPLDLGGRFSPFAVPSVIPWVSVDPEIAFRVGTWSALRGLAAIAVLVVAAPGVLPRFENRCRSLVAVCLVVTATSWFVHVGLWTVRGTEAFARAQLDRWSVPASIHRLGIRELDIEEGVAGSRPTLIYPFFLPDVAVRTYEADRREEPAGPYALARLDDPDRAAAGDRVALLDRPAWPTPTAPMGLALWVAPGPEQARLQAAGWLLPPGFPTALPESARSPAMSLPDGGGQVQRIAPGGTAHLEAAIQHTGTGSPWPDRRAFPHEGRVVVRAIAVPEHDPSQQYLVGVGELPRWMQPGDTASVDIGLLAYDLTMAPLPPGRYRTQLYLTQEGLYDWAAPGGPDSWFWLDVHG